MLGEVGKLPDIYTEVEISFYLLRRLLGVKGDAAQGKVCITIVCLTQQTGKKMSGPGVLTWCFTTCHRNICAYISGYE